MVNQYIKFLALGIAALSLSGAALAQNDLHDFNTFKQNISHNIEQAHAASLLTTPIHLHIKKINVDSSHYDFSVEAANNMIQRADGSCDVNIGLSKDGHVVSVGEHENVKALARPQNLQQINYNNEFITLHESSHCEYQTISEPILVKNNPEIQKNVNYFYKHGFNSFQSLDLYNAVSENFADTYAAIQMIKMHGTNPDLLRVLKAKEFERHDLALVAESKDSVRSHYTSFSLSKVLDETTLLKIKNIDNPIELKQLALEIANSGVQKMIMTNDKGLGEAFTKENITTGVVAAVFSIANQQHSIASNSLDRATGFDKEATVENSFVYKMAYEYIKINGISDFKMEKNKFVFTGDLKKHINKVQDVVEDGIGNEMDKIKEARNYLRNEIRSNNMPSDLEKMSSQTSEHDYLLKRAELYKDFVTYTDNLTSIKVEPFKLSGKNNVLKNMADLRSAREPAMIHTKLTVK
jgi:hypothetical protein